MREQIVDGIDEVLDDVIACGDFVQALYQGRLGSKEEGAYPDRAGQDTVANSC